jgi:multidrug efflux pump
VVLVVILFLQTWRASIIPLIAVPVSVVGTFAALHLLVSRSTHSRCSAWCWRSASWWMTPSWWWRTSSATSRPGAPLEAAHQAMQEVSGPIIAIALVLCAVFVPMAFLSGVTGQFYKQFAVTIAISTVISAINSLTLSPALAAKLLKSHGTPKDGLSRLIERLFGWVFRPFNRFFKASSDRYQGTVSRTLKHRGSVFAVYALLLVVTGMLFQAVPRGFIPTQDKLYLMAGVKLPEGASLDRTDAVLRQVVAISKTVDGIAHVVAMTGLNPLQFTNTPNYGIAFLILKPFDERHRSAKDISEEMNQKISAIKEGITFVLMPPPILGLGNGAGYGLFVEDRAGLGFGALQNAVGAGVPGRGMQTPGLGYPISSYQANVPQLDAEVDRVKAKAQGVRADRALRHAAGVPRLGLCQRLQPVRPHLAACIAQADGDFRDKVEDIANLKTRNAAEKWSRSARW